ncbi:MAG: cation transporter [Candidatus Paceibacterota bacterium]
MVSRRSAGGLLVMVGLIVAGFGALSVAAAQGDQFAQAAQCRVLSIQGMTCETCAAHVQTALAKIPGVADARVSYPKSEAMVCSKAGIDVPVAALIDAVKKTGYKATLKR